MARDAELISSIGQGDLSHTKAADYFATGGRPFFLQFPAWVSYLSVVGHSSTRLRQPKAPPAPGELHLAFDPVDVKPWEPGQFEMLDKLQDATRNRGQVLVMRDAASDQLVAVKRMPNDWVRKSHADFVSQYPQEAEQPWQDIGCNSFLSNISFPYSCQLLGVYRNDEHTAVVTQLASEGDLFSWCGERATLAPGPEREALMKPLARQIFRGVQHLHNMSIVHRDISLENLVVADGNQPEGMQVRVIDFGMASTARNFHACVNGKPSYQAPELHNDGMCDAFLTDAFALGVSLYAALTKDYPWLSTRPGGCKCFDFFNKNGFRKYIAKRKLRGMGGLTVENLMSEELAALLEGLLALDPEERLTLGETAWEEEGRKRRNVWDEPWLTS
mmetsp:Transcript_6672/g.12429  ORF Transcript_6672/g.12429 Transcript_6672/m.12429 type:complete len:388 (-) Transcript_6672:184-1347(-)